MTTTPLTPITGALTTRPAYTVALPLARPAVTTVAARMACFLLARLVTTPVQPTRATRVEQIPPGTFYPGSAFVSHALWDVLRSPFSEDARNRITRSISLLYTGSKPSPWASQITENPRDQGNLVLSAQPVRDQIGAFCDVLPRLEVVRLLERWETENNQMVVPIGREEWERRGVPVHHIETRDFYPLSQEQFSRAVKVIRDIRAKRGNALVHCKAGVGRSAAAVIAYLATTRESGLPWSPELPESTGQVINYLRTQRPVNLNAGQLATLNEWVDTQRAIQS